MMKRGRPNIRKIIHSNLLEVLGNSQTPLTTSTLTKYVSKEVNRTISWNTVQKYVNELIEQEKIQSVTLPHSKIDDRNGLTMYSIKKPTGNV